MANTSLDHTAVVKGACAQNDAVGIFVQEGKTWHS